MDRFGMSVVVSHPGAGSISEQIALFAQIGFNAVFLGCGVTDEYERIPAWAEEAAAHGIRLEAVHLPNDPANTMWGADPAAAERGLGTYAAILRFCAEGGVEKAVLHPATYRSEAVSEAGLARFAALERLAKELGVRLCYENSDMPRHLNAVLSRADPFHGFCYDTGHRNCYTPGEDPLGRHGGRLLFTHLHDNDGKSDQHALPFDGTVDWNNTVAAIKRRNYRGTLNLELAARLPAYREMPYEAFVREAYRRLEKLEKI